MMFSTATKKVLALVIALAIFFVGIVMLAKQQPNDRVPSNTEPLTAQVDQLPESVSTDQSLESAPLYITDSATFSTISLDSKGKKINAIAIRFRLDQASIKDTISFKLDASLIESGWQAIVSDSTDGNTTFEIALINPNPDGGQIFTQYIPVGVLNYAQNVLLTLDQTVSMAAPAGEKQLKLQLIRL
jgi:hypothetical protein